MALFLRGFRKISDQLAQVGLKLPGIAAPRFCGDIEPEGPCAGYVEHDAECLEGGQCLREFVTSAWSDEFAPLGTGREPGCPSKGTRYWLR